MCKSVRKKICGSNELKLCLEELPVDNDAEDITDCSSTDCAVLYWCIAAADMDEENASTLLRIIVESWVTFVGAWVELYKQRTKNTLKCSKGIRKALFTSKTE